MPHQTETNGDAPCCTNYFVFGYASMTNHTGMYKIKIKEYDKRRIIIIIEMIIVINKQQ